jgi:hypothetical protein
MKITNYIYLVLLIIVGCKRDCTKSTDPIRKVYQYDIPLLFPYDNIKSIAFLKNKKDTIVFHNLGISTSYSYTNTLADCPVTIPLEQKYITFVDSIEGNSFILFYYTNESLNSSFRIIINNMTMADGHSNQFIMPYPPVKSKTILGIKYDTISSWQNNHTDSLIFKAKRGGLISFTTDNNIFELIPQ